MKKAVLFLAFIFLLNGCVQTTTGSPGVTIGFTAVRYSIHELTGNERGSVFLLPIKEAYEGDLVFKNFSKFFYEGLIRNGFTVAEDPKSANYIGFINFGIITPEIKPIMVDRNIDNKKIIFETGNYTITSAVGKPQLDWLGYPTGKTTFERITELYLYDMSKNKPNQLLYSKITSTGQCSNIAALADKMGEVMFKDYPPKNAQAEEHLDFKINTGC